MKLQLLGIIRSVQHYLFDLGNVSRPFQIVQASDTKRKSSIKMSSDFIQANPNFRILIRGKVPSGPVMDVIPEWGNHFIKQVVNFLTQSLLPKCTHSGHIKIQSENWKMSLSSPEFSVKHSAYEITEQGVQRSETQWVRTQGTGLWLIAILLKAIIKLEARIYFTPRCQFPLSEHGYVIISIHRKTSISTIL